MARAHARSDGAKWRTEIATGRHTLVADEPAALEGADAGPAPYDLLCASLAACTSITLRMYAARKGWPLAGIEVDVHFTKGETASSIERVLTLAGDLDADQRARLADIAERTPVTLTLKQGVAIGTRLA
ncbi:MAG: OsmC family protein [Alphaproteobacteria bacterium]|nr:OsmC family protein [Alphaproteobacteria bacterium]